MSLYTTHFQGPVMAATGEQRCLKLTFVSLASIRVPSVSSGQISAETETTQTRIVVQKYRENVPPNVLVWGLLRFVPIIHGISYTEKLT